MMFYASMGNRLKSPDVVGTCKATQTIVFKHVKSVPSILDLCFNVLTNVYVRGISCHANEMSVYRYECYEAELTSFQ